MHIQNLLTFKQQRVLGLIREQLESTGDSPTLEELRTKLGFSSLRTVTQYLDILERKGYIVRRKNLSRNIELRNVDGGFGTVYVPGD